MEFEMKILNINSQYSKLKVWYFQMPNASYTGRCVSEKSPPI